MAGGLGMDKMREEFEKWALANGWFIGRDGEIYLNTYVFVAFEAWQASRAALIVELPKPNVKMDVDIDDVRYALDKAGIKYE